ncbi:hypothetical protein [Streptomyces sp. NPDC008240]
MNLVDRLLGRTPEPEPAPPAGSGSEQQEDPDAPENRHWYQPDW